MLGRITGKATTLSFSFELLPGEQVRKFDYVKVAHRVYNWVLCQVVEIEVSHDKTVVKCHILGYEDEEHKIRQIRIPFDMDAEVHLAEDDFIARIIQLGEETASSAYIGLLEGKQIPVRLDLSKLLTKHVAVLAKSGAGKSYAVGVLIEEIMERNVPVLVIDPHGEYGCLNQKNEEPKDKELMAKFKVKPKAYKVKEYGEQNNPAMIPLRLPCDLTPQEVIHLIPSKLNNTQLGVLYGALKGMEHINFDTVLLSLESEESSAKWSIINIIEHIRSLGVFSNPPIAYNELIKSGVCSVVNMRGISPEIQQVIVYKLAKDLFELRKQNKVPPFFLVVEEAHNYCPERSFGEATSSKVLRTIASEGRKFGLGLCVISQRPARVDKSILSQCTTELILKVTNPNDLKAVSSSVEGMTAEAESEIQNLPIGTALVTGLVDVPLFVNIRPRKTKHGGHSVNILEQHQQKDFMEQRKTFEDQSLLPLIKPKMTPKDLALMSQIKVKELRTMLVPAYLFTCKDKENQFNILMDMTNGEIVTDVEEYTTRKLPDLKKLNATQLKILQTAHHTLGFTKEDIVRKAGLALEIDEDLKDLVVKKYLYFDPTMKAYTITDVYLLSKLIKHACFNKVVYEPIQYTAKLEEKLNLDAAKESLSRFTIVVDQQECNIVRHEVVAK